MSEKKTTASKLVDSLIRLSAPQRPQQEDADATNGSTSSPDRDPHALVIPRPHRWPAVLPDPCPDIMPYFAFGSNMSTAVLCKRRKLIPVCPSFPAVLPGYRLVFNLMGVAHIEPGFGNLVRDETSCVHGVVHYLSRSDFVSLLDTEFGHGDRADGYLPESVHVLPYASAAQLADGAVAFAARHGAARKPSSSSSLSSSAPFSPPPFDTTCDGGATAAVLSQLTRPIHAYTLIVPPTSSHLSPSLILPSKRYRQLLVDGAVEFKLVDAYTTYLSNLPVNESAPWQRRLTSGILIAMMLLLLPYIAVMYVYLRANGRAHHLINTIIHVIDPVVRTVWRGIDSMPLIGTLTPLPYTSPPFAWDPLKSPAVAAAVAASARSKM